MIRKACTALPALGFPESGFLVSPVLAWSHQLRYLHPANPAEVSAIHVLPLATVRGRRAIPGGPDDEDGVLIGTVTATILDLLAGSSLLRTAR